MDILLKIMGAVDVIAALVLIFNPNGFLQIVGWVLMIKVVISLLS